MIDCLNLNFNQEQRVRAKLLQLSKLRATLEYMYSYDLYTLILVRLVCTKSFYHLFTTVVKMYMLSLKSKRTVFFKN